MPTLFTIGFTKKPLAQFIGRLQAAGVDAIVDTRLRPLSQLAGFAKKDDLAFILELCQIAYEHRPDLAPTDEILDTYRQDKDWAAYEARFRPLIQQRAIESIGYELLGRYRAPCLLCSEDTADRCHRRLVAEYWAEHVPGLEIVHL
ncbi:MAG: DUF488 domain-containing protein [Chloroflexota bacterium]